MLLIPSHGSIQRLSFSISSMYMSPFVNLDMYNIYRSGESILFLIIQYGILRSSGVDTGCALTHVQRMPSLNINVISFPFSSFFQLRTPYIFSSIMIHYYQCPNSSMRGLDSYHGAPLAKKCDQCTNSAWVSLFEIPRIPVWRTDSLSTFDLSFAVSNKLLNQYD